MSTSGPKEKSASGPPKPVGPSKEPIAVLANSLDTNLRASAPDAYAGIIHNGDILQVLVTSETSPVTAAITKSKAALANPPSVKVVAGSKNSLVALQKMRDDVKTRIPEWKSKGIELTHFGVDIRRNRVNIGVKNLTPGVKTQIEQELGVEQVVVEDTGEWYGQSRTMNSSP